MPIKGKATSIASRIKGKFRIDPETGCHIWTGSHSSQGKYPTIGEPGTGKPIYVHRAIWSASKGPYPEHKPEDGSFRFEIHHHCFSFGKGNRSCINPDHCTLVSAREHRKIHTFERRWKKALSKLRPSGIVVGTLAEAA